MFSPANKAPGVYVQEVPSSVHPITGASTSTAAFIGMLKSWKVTWPVNRARKNKSGTSVLPTKSYTIPTDLQGVPVLCTSFAQFERQFGGFSMETDHNRLAHAVFGFFNNGGALCYVMVLDETADLAESLKPLNALDDISLIAIPTNPYGTSSTSTGGKGTGGKGTGGKGTGGTGAQGAKTAPPSPKTASGTHGKTAAGQGSKTAEALLSACENLRDRFAILDAPEDFDISKPTPPSHSEYGAFYYPWIQVFDPPTKLQNPKGNGLIMVPPSGHIAGCYARTDNDRGVWKAPANVVINGALDVGHRMTDDEQGPLNSGGIDVLRNFGGDVTIWGARTMADLSHAEWKYVNVRRFFIFLEQSIKENTRWVVFEPNEPSLWAKITRNVNAFLTNLWQEGAMAGATPKEAFFVQCDASTNPPEVQQNGEVIIRIGVAPAYPAEFVVFEISQGLNH